MSMTANRRSEIEKLIDESYEIEQRIAEWQRLEDLDTLTIRADQSSYQAWYARALAITPEAQRVEFEDMYEGGSFIKRIKSFLASPLAQNDFYNPAEPNPFIDKWRHPFNTHFAENFQTQRGILQSLIYAVADVSHELDTLVEMFGRFPNFLQVLQKSRRKNVAAPRVENEADLQVLVHACLRLMYEDVRPEDYVPEHGGARSRVDFLLPDTGIVVETKMTRTNLRDKQVGDELIIDWERYSKHPDCRGIFALVYDPKMRLQNPAGLQSDLSNAQRHPATQVLVVR
ncbi:PD-(D/E)XK nuclease domain-containing protein [Streptomyces antibioticus]|uniref:PD-(D/E)XK nuclease domain-containing protein n=1 Tax=Streptomyces antibioticus TaxID=1890 RepID=UPI003698D97A